MVSKESIEAQLKRLGFKAHGWGKGEVGELPNIILPDEEIYECVNGIYEGGFALLLATDTRVLLVDKKPMSFLAVEDLRFDMINEIDYNHRLLGAFITIATGSKTLSFRSYNKERLRKLIGHVQHCMAETKKKQSTHEEGQNQHLEQINQQLQVYLMAQYKQQQALQDQLGKVQQAGSAAVPTAVPKPVKPSPELTDYLYARGLLQEYQEQTGQVLHPSSAQPQVVQSISGNPSNSAGPGSQVDEIYTDGMQEVFGKQKLNNAMRIRKFGLGRASLRPFLKR